MKMIFVKIIICITTAAILYGCGNSINVNDPYYGKQIYGSGKIVTESRNLSECSGITLNNVGKVYLNQGDDQSITIEADDNIIDRVITHKGNGSVSVGLAEGSYSNITLRIYITLKTIENISITGAGKVECTSPIQSDNLYCFIEGAGSLNLNGEADFLNCIINGTGNINAFNFTVKKCTSTVNGAGSCIFHVTDELYAVVSGAGSIVYYGNPPVVKTSVSGLGQIQKGL